ncbi:RagB/SusD family nutrient uptake outer membrane protein [Chitinophaga vietnamensis]|uniref:RagB/SusD family nutrient uptake outer membrane protein n=1 Tax=Chitinophaga vietnamensis TaxID=2593957 RepID=UPI0011784D35|nr:RagB/SusD family nutrient uptake outer membrane protein [Chitinophaga vietnamensis]
MKKISVYILLLTIAGLGACQKDKLNPVPTTDMPDFLAFQNSERIASQVNGLYAVMKNGKFLGGKFQIANEVRGEDYQNELSNSVTLNLTWRMFVGNETQEVKEIWSQGYLAINNANVFLDGMAAAGTKVVGDSLSKVYIGEAKFVRALSYFSLLQLYARPHWDGAGSKPGLVLYLDGHTKLGNYARARSTVNEIYAQVIKDLDSAEMLLPKKKAGTTDAVTRANAWSAIALKARAYLYMEQYDKVVAEASKIVSATAPFVSPGNHGLEPDITKVFATPYTTAESIFSLPFTSTVGDFPGTQTQLGFYFSPNTAGGNGEYSLISTGIISDSSWKPQTDARRKFLLAVPQSGGKPPKYYLNKYPTPSPYTDWAPILRYAEVLLNLAEARVRISGTVDAGAVALLSAVRHRSDPSVTYTTADFADAATLLAAIQKEKHIELLGEGFRSMEITRQGATFPARGGVGAVAPSAKAYIWPISSDELVYNKLCVDNQ